MGSKTTQQQSTASSTTPAGLAQLQSIYSKVADAASNPYNPYTGELTAGVNNQQQTGINNINANANYAQPYIQQAGTLASGASNPLTAAQIQQYQNPYTQNVVNATQAQFNNANGVQQQQVKGNAALAGALGGDRQAVAQAELANQQQLAQAPVIAGLYSNAYNSGLSTATNQFQTNPLAAASSLGNIGVAGQNSALAGAQAQVAGGTLQQQTQQAADTANLGQYNQAQAFPYQQAQYLASIGAPIASAEGSTTNGTSSTQSNPFASYLGLGTAAVTAYSDKRVKDDIEKVGKTFDGQPIYKFRYKGSPTFHMGLMAQDVEKSHPDSVGEHAGIKTVNYDEATTDSARRGHFATGGSVGNSPFNFITDSGGYIPQTQMGALTAPKAPAAPSAAASSSASPFQSIGTNLGTAAKNYFNNPGTMGSPGIGDPLSVIGGAGDYAVPTFMSHGGLVEAVHAIRKGIDRANGGAVSGYGQSPNGIYIPHMADGGAPDTFDQRFGFPFQNTDNSPIIPDPGLQQVSPQAMNAWRSGIDTPNPAIAASDGTSAPTAPTPLNNTSLTLPPQITGQPDDTTPDQSSPALGYSGSPVLNPAATTNSAVAPTADSQPSSTWGGFNPFGLSDKARQAIISGALGLAASKNPNIGAAIAEGGLKGLGAYSDATKAEQEAADKKLTQTQNQTRIDMEAKRIANQASQFAITNKGKGEMTDYQKEQVERQKREEALKLKTPIKIGESVSGAPIMALPRLNPQTNQVDLYPIGRDGTVAKEPVAPGSNMRPQASSDSTTNAPNTTQGKPDPSAPVGSPESRNQSYVKQVEQEDPAYAAAIKKAANYELDPAKYASMRTSQRQKFINDVIQYDPNYNPQDVGLRYRAQAAFLPGTKNGDTVTAFNTAISHLDTLKQMYGALKNGDVQGLNRLKNTFQQQFGYAAPNDVSALSSIIGGEVVKATVGSQNALGDREEVRHSIGRDLSTQQADSVIDKYQALMAGQLKARKYAYQQGTGLHNFDEKFLLPRSKEILNSIDNEGGNGRTGQNAIPSAPNGIPQGSMYSPSRKQWKTPDGKIFNADGSPAS